MPVDTRKAHRRTLTLASIQDLEQELERVRAAYHSKTLRASGNWTPGQMLGHLAKWMSFSFDGYPFDAPAWIRFLARPFRDRLVRRPMSPGIAVTPSRGSAGDDPDYPFEVGYDLLRTQLDRLRAGEAMDKPSPVFGRLTQDQMTALHLNHAALHLSFLHMPGDGGSTAV